MLDKNTNINEKANRLIDEKSPYLLQHAYNPVDWYPWGKEAFQKAKRENKPIFLSIGYSSCHWCHVMEDESFEDEGVASLLNENFISIKVDREERPDIDSIYMTACQVLTGRGGWPLSVFITPDKKPFYAGSYFPKESRYGMPGFVDILKSITSSWEVDQERIIGSGDNLINAINKFVTPDYEEMEEKQIIKDAVYELYGAIDDTYGGFWTAPKFPSPHNLYLLLKHWKSSGDERALKIVEKTLESMYKGGIFDHVGYGFSRYSTDEKWLVPHFEKMLYDNALLAYAYVEAYSATKNVLYKEVAEKIFTYVLRDMRLDEGGFYSAEDADSEGEEGKFYVWTVDEIIKTLGEEEGESFCNLYNITKEGNFEGRNIPNLINTDIEQWGDDVTLKRKIYTMLRKLYHSRNERIHPLKDDKILTSWNGLMIAALAYGGKVFHNDEYIKAAECAVDFILKNLVRDDGRLLARYREGDAAYLAYLEDYTFVVWALIELYEATYDMEYIKKALSFNEEMLDLFWDNNKGGLFLYGRDAEQLIVRPKEVYDGAIPSGNSAAAHNMIRLFKITGDMELERKAKTIFMLFGGRVKENPTAYTHFVSALLENTVSGPRIIISGDIDDKTTKEMIEVINEVYNPFKTVILNNGDEELSGMIPMLKEQNKVNGKTTAYVCEGFTCKRPITDVEELKQLLHSDLYKEI